MPFDYKNMTHNVNLLIDIFCETPEEREKGKEAIKLSMRYLGGFIEEALLEGLRKKGFIIEDPATLQIVMQDYTRNIAAKNFERIISEGKPLTVRTVIELILSHLGIESTAEIESEMNQLDMENTERFQ